MKKYLQYKAADFAEDLDFIRWVQTDFTEYADKWDTFMNDNPSLGDEISEAIDIIELFQFEEPTVTTAQRDNLLTKINNTIDEEAKLEKVVEPTPTPVAQPKPQPAVAKTTATVETSSNPSKSIFRYLIPLAAAACFAAFMFFNTGSDPSIILNDTGIAETTSITLPDQSTVNLNATSSLSFDENNFSKDRKLKLDGEAFFSVEKGQRFMVETKNGTVEVLGTSFNVFSRENFFEVECKSGKVKVVNKSGQSIVLNPNETCKQTGSQLQKTLTKVKESDWTKGIYHFEEMPLSEVISELERQFKVAVVMTADVENKKYTGSFEKKNLKDALHAITWPLGLAYTIDDNLTNNKKGVVIKVAE